MKGRYHDRSRFSWCNSCHKIEYINITDALSHELAARHGGEYLPDKNRFKRAILESIKKDEATFEREKIAVKRREKEKYSEVVDRFDAMMRKIEDRNGKPIDYEE